MKQPLFTGTGVALVTPFRKQQETVDFSKLETLIETIINNGVDYIVALGTTSEAATMTANELLAVKDFIVEAVAGRCFKASRGIRNEKCSGWGSICRTVICHGHVNCSLQRE